MRKTGLKLLGDVPWGRHVALFYERKDDLTEIACRFSQLDRRVTKCRRRASRRS
jgi:hypothetical protein